MGPGPKFNNSTNSPSGLQPDQGMNSLIKTLPCACDLKLDALIKKKADIKQSRALWIFLFFRVIGIAGTKKHKATFFIMDKCNELSKTGVCAVIYLSYRPFVRLILPLVYLRFLVLSLLVDLEV